MIIGIKITVISVVWIILIRDRVENMKRKICLLFIAILILMVGCGNQTDVFDEQSVDSTVSPGQDTGSKEGAVSEENEADGKATEDADKIMDAVSEKSDVADSLTYIDAWGEWHTNPIDTTCKMHDYKWDGLVNDGQNISYDNAEYTIRKGIDISYHQGTIDFNKVKADGYEFVIVRVAYRGYGTTGSLNEDKMFREYIEKAQAAGLDTGVYIFSQAINETEAMEEAELVLKLIEGYDLQLPVVYDPEFIRDADARTDHISGEQFTANTITFCERIKEAGYEPMIYSNMIWEGEVFLMSQLQDYRFWYADYEQIPQTPYAFDFWQYSGSGSVDGISGETDLDVQFIKK